MANSVMMLNGYRLVYSPTHRRAMSNCAGYSGYVYEHIEVVEKYYGPIAEDEVVHHLDDNRANNRHENLLVLRRGEHKKLHDWLSAAGCESAGGIAANSVKAEIAYCAVCGRTLQDKQVMACCQEHYALQNRKVRRPTAAELKDAISKHSMLAVGRMYGVSDNAVRKWCRQYGIVCQRRARQNTECRDCTPRA